MTTIRGLASWLRRHLLIVVPYLLVIAVAAGGLLVLERQAHTRCLERQADRSAMRQVVVVATAGSSRAVDLTRVVGFDQLDPVTQEYLRALSAAISSNNPSDRVSLRDELLAQLPPIDC